MQRPPPIGCEQSVLTMDLTHPHVPCTRGGMNILLIGSGGREHALAWALAKSPRPSKLYCAPGNAGIADLATCVRLDGTDPAALAPSAIRPGIILVNVPFYHIAGALNIYTAVYKESTLVIIPQFDPGKALRLIEKEEVTETYLVPTMLRAILDHSDFKKRNSSSLKRIRYGAAPMPPDLILRAIKELPCAYYNAFGQTETSGTAIALSEEDHRLSGGQEEIAKKLKRLSGIGRPIPEISCRLIDERGSEVAPGEIGEILVRGDKLMKGYWNNPEETAKALKDGWLRTGDLALMDEDGYLYLADRKRDVINRGGEKIFPAELESVLNQHPKILESAVVGVPDEYWGERVQALVVLREGATCSEEEIVEFCRSRLASYKKPPGVRFLPELPKNAVGKVLKYVLREKVLNGGKR